MTTILIVVGVVVLAVGALRMRALSRRLARLERDAVRRWERPSRDRPPPHVDFVQHAGDRERPRAAEPYTLPPLPTVQQLAALGKPLSRFGG